jgi:hypothetical protein
MSEQSPIPGITSEEFKRVLRIEEIFMPEARRQRLQARFSEDDTAEPTRLVHYTSAEAALKIIQTKRMWMRNTTCMTDYKEVRHGLELTRATFDDETRRQAFLSAMDKCHPGAVAEAAERLNELTNDMLLNSYVASFSEHDDKEDLHGRLSMWRAFGGTTRVAIVFRIPKYSKSTMLLNFLFSPVSYLPDSGLAAVMQQVTDNAEKNCGFLKSIPRQQFIQIIFVMFHAAAVCLKHEGFREEREWRAIYSPTIRPSPLMESSMEVINGIPQTVYKIPMDATASNDLADIDLARMFDRIIIGPTPTLGSSPKR